MGRIIREDLKKKTEGADLLFVFPSDVAADSWSEWAAMKPDSPTTRRCCQHLN